MSDRTRVILEVDRGAAEDVVGNLMESMLAIPGTVAVKRMAQVGPPLLSGETVQSAVIGAKD